MRTDLSYSIVAVRWADFGGVGRGPQGGELAENKPETQAKLEPCTPIPSLEISVI